MREIKFRGKRVSNGEWVYGHFVELIEDYDHDNEEFVIIPYIVSAGEEYREIDRKTLGQYTGLKDKNGKEIYEGDIVKTDIDGYEVAAVIKWHIDGFVLCLKQVPDESGIPKGALFGLPRRQGVLEVIGNIYDNPELLCEEDDE